MSELVDKQRKNKKKQPRGRGWPKGQSGNPKGRPRKEVCITSGLKELLLSVPPITDKNGNANKRTGVELVTLAWLQGMLKGNPVLIKEALERIEGKIPQALTGVDGGPIITTRIIMKDYAAVQGDQGQRSKDTLAPRADEGGG